MKETTVQRALRLQNAPALDVADHDDLPLLTSTLHLRARALRRLSAREVQPIDSFLRRAEFLTELAGGLIDRRYEQGP